MKRMQVSPYQLSNGKWRVGGTILEGQLSSVDFTEYASPELFNTKEEAENFVINLCKKGGYELEIK